MKSRKRKRKFIQAKRGDDDVLIEVEKTPQKRLRYEIGIEGCNKPKIKIKVTNFSFQIAPATTYETEFSLRCKSTEISTSATVRMPPLNRQETWQVGFVQACTDSVNYNTYGDHGTLVWTYPQLHNGEQEMMNDSCGRNYPFYGDDDESVFFEGPCDTHQEAIVKAYDAPSCTTPWCHSEEHEQTLTNMFRKQNFKLWLIAKNITTGETFVLKGMEWSIHTDIDVDTTAPIGKRAHLISDQEPKIPTKLRDLSIPYCALMPPHCNGAQVVTWYPRGEEPQCMKKSKCSC